ncbi:MAG: glycosyltransferase [Paludibacteraceae bacterium]|nr:glycosyltransferase [Paludibacteraceae bacterium]
MKTNLTIIVIGHNSWHYLQKNFASLEFLKEDPEVEVLYVDNASTDETRAAITYSYPYIKMINCGMNRGIAAARNIGMVNSASDYLLFLDSDTEMNKEALEGMRSYMENHEDVGVCSCKLIGQDGLPQASCKHFPTRLGVVKSGLHNIGVKFGLNLFAASYAKTLYDTSGSEPMEVDFVIGACQLIRKKAQIKVGFLDERIFYGPEDADFCRRMKKKGYKTIYLPYISISHDYQRPITKKFMSLQTLKQIKGYSYYFRKIVEEKMRGI